jgi:hypothetical protein
MTKLQILFTLIEEKAASFENGKFDSIKANYLQALVESMVESTVLTPEKVVEIFIKNLKKV